ncbi:hypothetical protein VTI74DRAFT_4460 [Chaetomium olivicolor]
MILCVSHHAVQGMLTTLKREGLLLGAKIIRHSSRVFVIAERHARVEAWNPASSRPKPPPGGRLSFENVDLGSHMAGNTRSSLRGHF